MKIIAGIFGLTAICLLTICHVRAQNVDALRVLNSALQTLGGEAKIKSFQSIYFSAKGIENGASGGQDYYPEKESANAHEEKLAVFLDGVRLAYEYKTDRGDGTARWRRFFFMDTRRIVADFGTKFVSSSNIKLPSIDRNQDARRIPHLLLLEVLANSATLKNEGTRNFENKENEVVSIILPNTKIPLFLYFDKQTKLLSKYEYTTDFPSLGNVKIEYIFSGYRGHPQLNWFPAEHSIKINGKIWHSVKFDQVSVDSKEAESMFQLPPELEGYLIPAGTVKEIAKGVYFVYGVGGFQPMFIEFKDFIMAIEAPAVHPNVEETPLETIGNADEITNEFIAKIKQTIPNKPIKYVAITHCHDDHVGGLRAFAAEKPMVLITPGNKDFYERFAPGIKDETFNDKRIVSEGEKTVELISVGPNPHTQEMLVVYLPKENYMFQGDLFYLGSEPSFPVKDRLPGMIFFADWLRKNNLSPARIYGFHTTLYGSMDHIKRLWELEN